MSQAFEITPEDVSVVLSNHGRAVNEEEAERLFNDIILPEVNRVEAAALKADVANSDEETLSNQTTAAHQEILALLREAGTN